MSVHKVQFAVLRLLPKYLSRGRFCKIFLNKKPTKSKLGTPFLAASKAPMIWGQALQPTLSETTHDLLQLFPTFIELTGTN